jgi:hypothetical protein
VQCFGNLARAPRGKDCQRYPCHGIDIPVYAETNDAAVFDINTRDINVQAAQEDPCTPCPIHMHASRYAAVHAAILVIRDVGVNTPEIRDSDQRHEDYVYEIQKSKMRQSRRA